MYRFFTVRLICRRFKAEQIRCMIFSQQTLQKPESVARIFPFTLQAPVVIKVESHLVAVVENAG